ncbi:MAG: ABC transporter permease [Deltaproteobacteria bacterium]|nr:MAG: ABC transporter permease [Deltaproteobacteria bacterium]
MLPTSRAFRVWRRDLESWKRFAPSFFIAALSEPVFYLLGIGYGLGRFVTEFDGTPYAVFLAPGIIAFSAMNSATFETTIGAFTRMVEQQTYAAILATPCSVADIVAGDVLWAASKSVLAVSLVLALCVPFHLVHGISSLLLVPVGFLVGLMFDYYFSLVFSVMFLFSGVFFPLESLPVWGQWIAWVMPLTHAVRVCRALTTPASGAPLAGSLLWITATTILAFVIAERLVRRRIQI